MIRTDSRKIQPGDTFVALDGISSNGSQYIGSAIEKGAVKIVCREGSYSVETENVPDPRKRLEEMLAEAYGSIISRMTLIGVTGTNGKTSTCYFLSEALNALGRKCAYIGTIGFYMGEKVCDLPNTSVDICHLYELLLEAHEKGYDTVALEASSQGLALGRLNTIRFDVAAFTNLTEDHLDFHKTFDEYARSKRMLFDMLKEGGTAVVNADDPYYTGFLPDEGRKLITFGTGDTDIKIIGIESGDVTEFRFNAFGREYRAQTDIIGEYNVYNLITCMGCMCAIGIPADDMLKVLSEVQLPPGRMERYRYKNNTIIVDFAHTPDAFAKIYEAIFPLHPEHVITVFGCTGEREREKRPKMTRLALENSDHVFISSDDLHHEAPESITADMLEGNEDLSNYEVDYDRASAICGALKMLKERDVLLLLGLGPQNTISVGDTFIPHSDAEVVRQFIEEEQ